jgi:hypothetical protein
VCRFDPGTFDRFVCLLRYVVTFVVLFIFVTVVYLFIPFVVTFHLFVAFFVCLFVTYTNVQFTVVRLSCCSVDVKFSFLCDLLLLFTFRITLLLVVDFICVVVTLVVLLFVCYVVRLRYRICLICWYRLLLPCTILLGDVCLLLRCWLIWITTCSSFPLFVALRLFLRCVACSLLLLR